MDTCLLECLSCQNNKITFSDGSVVIVSTGYIMVTCGGNMPPGVNHRPHQGSRWEFTKNQTPGPHHRPHKSASSGGPQDSSCPTGFSEDLILKSGQKVPPSRLSWMCGKMSFIMGNGAGYRFTSCAYSL